MRTAVPLHEFMPYGAPDLIESRRRHMSHALMLASAMALALYALTIGLAAFLPARQIETIPIMPSVILDRWEYVEPARPMTPHPSTVPPASAVEDPAAVIPVPDELAPPEDRTSPVTESPVGSGPTGAATTSDAVGPVPISEGLPSRTEWVYVEELPRPIKQVKPEYPDLAQHAGVEGSVMVYAMVGKDGRVLAVELSEKVQVPMLNEAALAAARQWVFTPGLANGKPVVCWTAIPFRFRLN